MFYCLVSKSWFALGWNSFWLFGWCVNCAFSAGSGCLGVFPLSRIRTIFCRLLRVQIGSGSGIFRTFQLPVGNCLLLSVVRLCFWRLVQWLRLFLVETILAGFRLRFLGLFQPKKLRLLFPEWLRSPRRFLRLLQMRLYCVILRLFGVAAVPAGVVCPGLVACFL